MPSLGAGYPSGRKMKAVGYVLGVCLLLVPVASAQQTDGCSDLHAAIAKAAALRGAMQREAAPFLNATQIPTHHDGICGAAQAFRDHVVTLARMPGEKCLNDDEQKNLTATLVSSMTEANNNIGLFCN